MGVVNTLTHLKLLSWHDLENAVEQFSVNYMPTTFFETLLSLQACSAT